MRYKEGIDFIGKVGFTREAGVDKTTGRSKVSFTCGVDKSTSPSDRCATDDSMTAIQLRSNQPLSKEMIESFDRCFHCVYLIDYICLLRRST